MKNYLLVGFLALLMSCGGKSSNTLFPNPQNQRDIQYSALTLDTLTLRDTTSSYLGWSIVQNGKILFVDEYFCRVYEFTPDGMLVKWHLGEGQSKKETNIGHMMGMGFFDDGRSAYFGHQADVHVYDADFTLSSRFQMKNYLDILDDTVTNVANVAKTYCYCLKFVSRGYGDKLYMNIRSEVDGFNPVDTPKYYYENAHPLLVIDIKSGAVDHLLGLYPPVYAANYKDKSLKDETSFDIDKDGNFYVCFEADSTIYTYDHDYKALKAFGYAGRDMDTLYAVITSYDQFVGTLYENEMAKGRYDWVEYIDETGILMRSYTKSESATTSGLQIYRDNVMIADVDVPKGMRVVGYIAPYYYSQIAADPDTKTLKIYRFKL